MTVKFFKFITASSIVLLLIIIIYSLKWKMVIDTPVLFYHAFLYDAFNLVPYRDFFCFAMPGNIATYYFFAQIGGYSDLSIRIYDCIILLLILFFIYKTMLFFSREAAIISVIFFGYMFIVFGPYYTLQPDFICILPISIILYLVKTYDKTNYIKTFVFLIGFLFSVVFLNKPQQAFGLAPVLFFLIFFQKTSHKFFKLTTIIKTILSAGFGFLIPIFFCIYILHQKGALPDFLDIAKNYWPLYNQLTNEFKLLSKNDYHEYLIKYLQYSGGHKFYIFSAFISFIYFCVNNINKKNQIKFAFLILFLLLLYCITILISAKFFYYHWLPVLFFSSLLLSLCFDSITIKNKIPTLQKLIILIVLLSILLEIKTNFNKISQSDMVFKRNYEIAEKLSVFIDKNCNKNDNVQILDITDGGLHALLKSKKKIATKFLYDYYFYHHISNEYIQKIKKEFIFEIKQTKPKYIIKIYYNYIPEGVDCSDSFPELKHIYDTYYDKNEDNSDFTIYKIKQSYLTKSFN